MSIASSPLFPRDPHAPQPPPSYGGCRCECHRIGGVKHVIACCHPADEVLNRMALGDAIEELTMTRSTIAAARDLEETLAKLVKAGETEIVSTDIGAAAVQDRLNALRKALKTLDDWREKHHGARR